MDITDRTNLKKANVKVNKSMNEAIVIASEQVENQAKEMNENNLAAVMAGSGSKLQKFNVISKIEKNIQTNVSCVCYG
jgi:hypothetical protein